jgi:hypothetical protein
VKWPLPARVWGVSLPERDSSANSSEASVGTPGSAGAAAAPGATTPETAARATHAQSRRLMTRVMAPQSAPGPMDSTSRVQPAAAVKRAELNLAAGHTTPDALRRP